LEKVARLGELAADIARHPFLGAVLALKGGTALNLCFRPPARLSVDLDFNYIGQPEREKMLAERPRVETAVEQLARRRSYTVQRSADAFAGRKLYLGFASALGPNERIEVDLNFLFRAPLAGTEMREMWQPGELERPRLRVASLSELCAGKLLALLDRTAVRDAWDVGQLPAVAGELLTSRLFRARFIALSAILNHPLASYNRGRVEERVTDRAIAGQLVPILAAGEAPRASVLVERAWSVVGAFVTLEPAEDEYIAAIHRGELRTDLLFPDDPEAAARIAEHPAIQWKLLNVRSHRARPQRARAGPNSPDDATET
jgi:hypothetical protein